MATLTLTPWQRRALRRQLQQTRDAHVYRRTLAILEVAQSKPVSQVAQTLGVSRQSVHNWLADYRRNHDPTDLLDAPRSGRPPCWTEESQTLLASLVAHEPQQMGWHQTNWTVAMLAEELRQRCSQSFSEDTIRRELRRQGFVWKRPRYVLDPDPQREKKTAYPQRNQGVASTQCTVDPR